MNALGWLLFASVAHATGFALLASVAYLLVRRFSPAAGALAAVAGLVIMAMVSALVLGPWPRWWRIAPGGPGHLGVAESAGHEDRGETTARPLRAERIGNPEHTNPPAPDSAQPRNEQAPSGRTVSLFLGEFVHAMRGPTAQPSGARWGLPEWVALAFLTSLSVGLARLGLGIKAVSRLRAESKPIADGDIRDALDLLRAELSCCKKVELRESGLLATPATTGFRPVVLLPLDWRDWSPTERRAILAHELAHVCQGDFLAGFVAQLCLAVLFYHPLAHWLAARMRLEQELAADAWGALRTGGKQIYLTTLAQMALRRDSRALTWPARAFLPTHNTFLRRIAMLRNAKSIRHESVPVAVKALMVGALAATGLLVAGFRGPAGGSARAQAQDRAALKDTVSSSRSVAVALEPYDLSFLPADTKMVFGMQPAALLQRPEARGMLDAIRRGPFPRSFHELPPEEVKQLLVFWDAGAQSPAQSRGSSPVPPPSGFVLRMVRAADWKRVIGQIGDPQQEVQYDGQRYFRPAAAGPNQWCEFLPDDRTLVVAPEDLLRELISDRNAPARHQPWEDCWKRVAKGHAILALETRWLRRHVAQALQDSAGAPGRPPEAKLTLDTISPLLEKTHAYALAIDGTEKVVLDAVAAASSEDGARPVAETAQALLTLARNALQAHARDIQGHDDSSRAAIESSIQAVQSLLERARVDVSGTYVHLSGKSSTDFAQAIEVLVPLLTSATAEARAAQSTNNLKQIGLALHNYREANGHFPTFILPGGKNKTIPYSWRVAILPYIEQTALYNQYSFDEPWDGPNNSKLLDKMPATYAYPAPDGTPSSRTHAAYFVFTGPHTALAPVGPKGSTVAQDVAPDVKDFTDGTSNTIMVVEAKREIPWTKPEDIPFDLTAPVPELGGFTPKAFHALFADGSVRFLRKSIQEMVLRALITRDAGEVISSDSY